ncbi:hypothetical protein ACIFOC_00425 [Leucobacter aridicollis]
MLFEALIGDGLFPFALTANLSEHLRQHASEPVSEFFQGRVLNVEPSVRDSELHLGIAAFLKLAKTLGAKERSRFSFRNATVEDGFNRVVGGGSIGK